MTVNRIYLPLLAVLVVLAFHPPAFIKAFELRIYDLLLRETASNEPDPRIVIVGIDEASLNMYGRWPWPRNVIGDLVDKLAGFGVGVTALDMTFTTQSGKLPLKIVDRIDETIIEEGIQKLHPRFYRRFSKIREELSKDEALAEALERAGNVVTGFLFSRSRSAGFDDQEKKRELIGPFAIKMARRDAASRGVTIESHFSSVEPNIPIIQKASAASGFLNVEPDPDGVFRWYPMVIEHKKSFYPSLALASVMLYAGAVEDTQVYFASGFFEGVGIADHFINTDEQGMVLLRYLGGDGIFPVISAARIMKTPASDEKLGEALAGKIAFVGATATEIYDLRATPFGITAGVEVQANAAAAALNNLSISKLAWQSSYDAGLALVLGLVLLYVLRRVRVGVGLALVVFLFGALYVFNYWAFDKLHIWLNSVIPSVTIVGGFITVTVYQYVMEQKSKRFIKDAFGRYLSPKVINQIIENPGLLELGGEKRVMTAFFSDVAGFTGISEKLKPTELVALLNEYLTAMSEIILDLDGTIDKYEGDAIIAFWGAPIHMDNHAELCVLAAVRMQRKLGGMRDMWRAQGRDELYVRMGINTGPMVVGNMGSGARMDYTMMGDAVNLASRLEGANKYYGSGILISEFTRARVGDRFLLRELNMVRVAGKRDAIKVYEVIEETQNTTERQRLYAAGFEEAIAAFRAGDFAGARGLFEKLAGMGAGGDAALDLYLRRIAELEASPPSSGWDGVYDLAK